MFAHSGHPDAYDALVAAMTAVLGTTGGLDSEKNTPAEAIMKAILAEYAWGGQYTASEDPELCLAPRCSRLGLLNVGNSCYFNSAIQALFSVVEFRKHLLELEVDSSSPEILIAIQRLFGLLLLSRRPYVDPSKHYKVCLPSWFATGTQQDASEYTRFLLDKLSTIRINAERTLGDMFTGKQTTFCKCSVCGATSARLESFNDLSVPFPDEPPSDELGLEGLLRQALAVQVLQEANRYFCSSCAALQDATQWTTVTSAPSVLVLNLLRFTFDRKTSTRRKICTALPVALTLHLPVCADGVTETLVQYDLCTAIVHSGPSAMAGHYYCYTRPAGGADWLLLNDSRTTATTFESLSTLTARFPKDTPYILFFQRTDVTPSEMPVHPTRAVAEAVAQDNAALLREQQAPRARPTTRFDRRFNGGSGGGSGGGFPHFVS